MTQRERYINALENFKEQVKDSPNVIALLLSGSLSYGTVWEKSDIDLTMLVRDNSLPAMTEYCIDEDGIDIHLALMEMSEFKRKMQKLRGGEYPHSYFGKGTVIFTKDESFTEFFKDAKKVGRDDAVMSFINMCEYLLVNMNRAEKWIKIFHDPLYAQHFLQFCCQTVADMELLRYGEEPTRESILRAVELNPGLMHKLYVIPSTTAMTEDEVLSTIKVMDDYLMAHIDEWSKPILNYLSDGEVKTLSNICRSLNISGGAVNYLAVKGFIERVTYSSPIFPKSKLRLEEVAYLYIK